MKIRRAQVSLKKSEMNKLLFCRVFCFFRGSEFSCNLYPTNYDAFLRRRKRGWIPRLFSKNVGVCGYRTQHWLSCRFSEIRPSE